MTRARTALVTLVLCACSGGGSPLDAIDTALGRCAGAARDLAAGHAWCPSVREPHPWGSVTRSDETDAEEFTRTQGWKRFWPDGASVAKALREDGWFRPGGRFGESVADAIGTQVDSGALIPLGWDPASKLFEFAVPGTGLAPRREGDDGWGPLVVPPDGAIVLVLIPGGRFTMGSPEGEGDDYERPAHAVTVPAFLLAKHECTQAQWAQLSAADGTAPLAAAEARLPAVEVSWTEARERLSGRKLRLPSEAEWEYACRAGKTTAYGFGDDAKQLGDHAWYNANSDRRRHPVGAKLANGFGLHDMHGNVWEWCEDAWHDSYAGAPDNGSAWLDKAAPDRVFRGGSWDYPASFARSADRLGLDPGVRRDFLGFRPARSVTP